MEKKFDIIVIGGGPGGYPAAIKASQLGKSVALVEAKELGGTCLNRGCIPSKTLIANADVYKMVKQAKDFGILISGEISIDFKKMVERKDQVISDVRRGLTGLINSNQITLFQGFAKFESPRSVKVAGKDNVTLSADKIIIATGSEPKNISAFPFDQKRILDSTSLLNLEERPKSLVIVGGGIIGCEFAGLYSAYGTKVTILEMMPRILPMESEHISSALAKAFKKKGIEIEVNAAVQAIETKGEGVSVTLAGGKSLEAEIALVAVGRALNTDKIGLEKAGVLVKENGMIAVNDRMETSIDGIFAVGDIASKWWLAHVATHQGIIAAINASGGHAKMHYNAIPSVIFTDPEIATVGLSLDAAISNGHNATLGSFPFQALGKAQASLKTEGFAEVVVDKRTGQILGAQVVGHDAGALIAEMALAIANELTLDSITETVHAHPTASEAWLEAALVANSTPLHFPPKRKERAAV